jgi:HK97 family phage portal protein
MKILGFDIRREQRAGPQDPRVPISAEGFLQFLGVQSVNLPAVTLDSALQVPAFAAAVTFLPSTLANLPLHAYRTKPKGSEKVKGGIQSIINEAPNDEWTSFDWRKYHWHQVFTGGRGVSWIERRGSEVLGIWPMDPSKTIVKRVNSRKIYEFDGRAEPYSAADVIDTPFLLKRDMLASFSPLVLGAKALQLSLAMGDYASNFFAGGGVPPLALSGPLPAGADAMKRAQADVKRSIDAANKNREPVMPIPAGYTLSPVGIDPEKGQMTDARLFQIQEIARLFGLPPVFLQDLSRGTFANVEQQDLYLVKHLVAQWAKAFEDELNLKLFGRGAKFYVEHSLDGLMRGDFKTRMEGLSKGIQNALLTPNEGRALENRTALPNGDDLLVQGATVPLGQQPAPNAKPTDPPANPDDGDTSNDQP